MLGQCFIYNLQVAWERSSKCSEPIKHVHTSTHASHKSKEYMNRLHTIMHRPQRGGDRYAGYKHFISCALVASRVNNRGRESIQCSIGLYTHLGRLLVRCKIGYHHTCPYFKKVLIAGLVISCWLEQNDIFYWYCHWLFSFVRSSWILPSVTRNADSVFFPVIRTLNWRSTGGCIQQWDDGWFKAEGWLQYASIRMDL